MNRLLQLIAVSLLLTLAGSASAESADKKVDSMTALIAVKQSEIHNVYFVVWSSGKRLETTGVNARSIDHAIQTMREQMNVPERDIYSVYLK